MIIEKPAAAGTLESCDAQVLVEPGSGGLEIELDSKVMQQFGRQIRSVILDTLSRLNVTDARITVKDMGALDCTIRARVEAAVYRSAGQTDQIPWEILADEK